MPFSGEEIINGTAGTIVVCVETVGVIVPRTTDTVFSAATAVSAGARTDAKKIVIFLTDGQPTDYVGELL